MSKINLYIGGTFDDFHVGHVELLKEASYFGSVIVAVNTDEFVERYKGKKPIIPLHERMEILDSCKYIDKVIVNIGDEYSTRTIDDLENQGIQIKAIVHGSDWVGDSLFKQMGLTEEWLHEKMISMIYIPRTKGVSSTKIKQRHKDILTTK